MMKIFFHFLKKPLANQNYARNYAHNLSSFTGQKNRGGEYPTATTSYQLLGKRRLKMNIKVLAILLIIIRAIIDIIVLLKSS